MADQLPLELQQLILDTFKSAFRSRFSGKLNVLLQEIKGHLYNREFERAFGSEAYLEAYAVRWSPSRALCYLDVFSACLKDHLGAPISQHGLLDSSGADRSLEGSVGGSLSDDLDAGAFNVTCLGGGGGAEFVALASYLGGLYSAAKDHQDDETRNAGAILRTSVRVVDIADWSDVLKNLESSLSAAGSSSSASAEHDTSTSKRQLLSSANTRLDFHQQDLLKMSVEELAPLVQDARLITLMFTLNELYSASMGQTTRLLLQMSALACKGTLLLVVDSPGSYSTVSVGASSTNAAQQKKYPMHWLLDHTLLSEGSEKAKDEERGWKWQKLVTKESQWFRLPAGLKYPIDLEDMRYQMHLYRLT